MLPVATQPTTARSQRDDAVLAARPKLESLARRLVWNPEDARDVVQAALADALAHWHTVKDPDQADGWLRRLVVNRAWTLLRKRRFWNTVGALLLVPEELPAQPDDAAERSEHLAALSQALARLPARQTLAFSLRYLEGWSIDEVAAAMTIDRGTVRVHLQRAVQTLREKEVLP